MKKFVLILFVLFLALCAMCGCMTDTDDVSSIQQESTIGEASFETISDTADSDEPASDVEGAVTSDEESSEPQKEHSVPNLDISIPDEQSTDTPEVSGTALEGKFGKYTFVSEENGMSVAGIYTATQVKELNDMRANGGWMTITEEDVRFLLADTINLFEEYDLIRVTDIGGTVKTYAGIGYYATEEYNSLFNKVIPLPDLTFSLDADIRDVLITRIEVLYPLVLRQEEIVSSDGSRYDIDAILVCGYENAPDDSEYREICGDIAFSYTFQRLTDKIKDNSQTVVLLESQIHLRKVNEAKETEIIFENLLLGKAAKYEFATDGQSAVLELYDEKAKRIVALVRITDKQQLAEIERMWVALFDTCGDTGFDDNSGVDKYRVSVFFNGLTNFGYFSSTNLNSFYYRFGENNDAWSFYGDFESNRFSLNGCDKLANYLDTIIAETLITQE